ncbi:hypothetical protein V5O48_013447 [Marasmius crinis-equi]|uniref:Transmembrane protein n=1 Tax=Marasmius crinis-equi TaxID=585013 RepID=A0ABR3F046_9AGAR
MGGFVATGAGTYRDPVACSWAIIGCLGFVGVLQVLTSALFVEKVYIVWSNGFHTPRLQTRVFRICLLFHLVYTIVATLTVKGTSSRIVGDGVCMFGFAGYAWISAIAFTCAQIGFYTFMFCWPLYRAKLRTPALKTVAKKTLIGAISNMFTVITDTLVFVTQGRHEVAGVTIDALILYWVSSGAPSDSVHHFTLPSVSLPTSVQFVTSAHFERSVKHTTDETTALASAAIQTLHTPGHTIDLERHVTTQDECHSSVPPVTWKDVYEVEAKPPVESHDSRSIVVSTGDRNTLF